MVCNHVMSNSLQLSATARLTTQNGASQTQEDLYLDTMIKRYFSTWDEAKTESSITDETTSTNRPNGNPESNARESGGRRLIEEEDRGNTRGGK